MELRHLRYFLALTEERHFGRAAARLHIAQPPLSRQIQALEKELKCQLFIRGKHPVELTPAGSAFLKYVRRAFAELELGVVEARRAKAGESGRIVVAYPSSLATSGLTELLRFYRGRFPAMELVLREMPPQDQLDALKTHAVDVGFVRGAVFDKDLATERVRRERLVVALPSDHPLASARRTKISLATLADEPWIVFPRVRGPSFFDQFISLCREAGFSPRIVQEAPQLDIISLVAAGFGVAVVPSSVSALGRSGVVYLEIAGSPRADLLAAWRVDETSAAVHEFLAAVRVWGAEQQVSAAAAAGRSRARGRGSPAPRGSD
jgi:DNA-binding transcriptional LysR family regulator